MKPVAKNLVSLAVGAALGGMVSGAMGGGFAIGTQSGSGTGNAFAGGAAVADDASVAWSNPAAMTLIPGKQVAGALHIVSPSFKFTNQGSTGAFASPPASTNDGGDGGDLTFIPNGFFTWAYSPSLSFGLALNVPFGLATEYDAGWRGQLQALKSEIKTVNINPSVGYKVSNTVSIGGGLSVQKVDAELTNFTGSAALGDQKLEADDVGYGFNIGIMVQATPATRLGAHYRSKIKYELEGTQTFSGTGVPNANASVTADLEVPATLSLSVFHVLNPQWELMADATWTGWDKLQTLTATRTTASALGGVGSVAAQLAFNWDNTWRYGVGANYKLSPQTKLRFGAAFDETPTNDVDRTARLPDQDRTWIAFGVQWKPSKTSILDVGYAHEFIKDARISSGAPPAALCPPSCLTGEFKSSVDILSVQYSMSF
ncbi:MAG: OmpP1/FadL family transporter [Burkholderiales bacterium]